MDRVRKEAPTTPCNSLVAQVKEGQGNKAWGGDG